MSDMIISDVLSARQPLPLCSNSRRLAVSQQATFKANMRH